MGEAILDFRCGGLGEELKGWGCGGELHGFGADLDVGGSGLEDAIEEGDLAPMEAVRLESGEVEQLDDGRFLAFGKEGLSQSRDKGDGTG